LIEEEESFYRTLDRGEKKCSLYSQAAEKSKAHKELLVKIMDDLYDTFGFPVI